MADKASRGIRKLIDIEENVGKLYRFFGSIHPTDFEFWMQLANEEDRHASQLRTHQEYIVDSPYSRRHFNCHVCVEHLAGPLDPARQY